MKRKEKKALPAMERALIESAEFSGVLAEALKDGRLTFIEAIEVAKEAIDLNIIYKEWPAIKEAWKNRTEETVNNWKKLFAEHFEISDDLAEKRIEMVINIITGLINFADTF